MSRKLTFIAALVILAVLALDGYELFLAYQSAGEVAQASADQAVLVYVTTHGNEVAGERAAMQYATSKNAEVVGVSYHGEGNKWFEVRVRVRAATHVLQFLPLLNRLLAPERTATAQL